MDVQALGEFGPRPGVLPRYGICVLETTVGKTTNEAALVREGREWLAKYGSFDRLFTGGKGLNGLPLYPPGTPLQVPAWVKGSGWRVSKLERQPNIPAPTVAQIRQADREGRKLGVDWWRHQ